MQLQIFFLVFFSFQLEEGPTTPKRQYISHSYEQHTEFTKKKKKKDQVSIA